MVSLPSFDMDNMFSSPANLFMMIAGCLVLYAFIPWLGLVAGIGLVFLYIKQRWG
jgi:hypothetical protein